MTASQKSSVGVEGEAPPTGTTGNNKTLESSDEPLQGGGYVPWIVVVALSIPRISLLCFVVLGGMAGFFSVEFFDLTEPLAGLRLRDTEVAEKSDGWVMAIDRGAEFWSEDSGSTPDVQQIQQSRGYKCLTVLYMTEVNMYTPERLGRMKVLEDTLVSLPGFTDFCKKDPNTGFCYGFNSVLNKLSDITNQTAINDDLTYLWANKYGSMKMFLSKEFNAPENMTSRLSRSTVCFGLPLAGYKNSQDRKLEQTELLEAWISKNGMEVAIEEAMEDNSHNVLIYNHQSWLEEKLTKEILMSDTMKCVLAIVFVLVVMILHMRSLFLAFFALTQVLLSFPVAFFIYRVLLGIQLFGGLQCIAIFVVLGVGADDCFIFCDAFKQTLVLSKIPGWTLEKRLSFAYKRAKFTMLVTTMTTGFAFLMLTISKIPTVRYFGIFSSLLIFCNFILVITMYTSVLVIWDRHIRTMRFHLPSFNASTTTKTEQEDEGDNTSTPSLAKSVKSSASSKVSNFIGKFVSSNKDDLDSEIAQELSTDVETNAMTAEEMVALENKRSQEEAEKFSPIAKVLTHPKYGKIIIGLFACICIVMIAMAAQLKISSSENPFFDDEHPIAIFRANVPNSFHDASDDPRKIFHVVHGLEDPFIDRSGTIETAKEDFGQPIPSTSFDLADPAAQQHLYDECKAVDKTERNLYLTGDGEKSAMCFMVAFALWREARNEPFPVPKPSSVVSELGLPVPPEATLSSPTFHDALYDFLNYAQFGGFKRQVGFNYTRGANSSRREVVFAFQSFDTSLDWEDSYLKRVEVFDEWELFLEEIRENTPASLGPETDTYYTEWDYFVLMVTQNMFLVNSFSSLGLSTILTLFFLIIASNNWRLALLAGITICGIISTVLGSIVILGWELDTIISVSITILVGFSVDYVVHFAVSYDEAGREKGIKDRASKTNYVMSTMMGSIIAGATSTFGAACMLFPTTIMFFRQFGAFLALAIFVALFFALLLLPSLLARFGPDNDDGRLLTCLEKERNVGIYHLEYHKSRKPKASKFVTVFAILLFIGLGFLIITGYGKYTDTFFWKPDVVVEEAVVSPWPNVGSNPKAGDMEANTWYKINPGGDTTCARGGEFAFFFKKSAVPNATLIIEFEGGNVCWNLDTCRAEALWISDTIDLAEASFLKKQMQGYGDPQGPHYEQAHILYIPLCTGDFHWGNNTASYSTQIDVSIHHKGAINAIASLQWVLGQLSALDVDNLFVTGSDSGSYASILYSTLVAGFLELMGLDDQVQLVQHGDGGLGLFAPDFMEAATTQWGTFTDLEEVQVQVGDQVVSVPLWGLTPDGSEDLFNRTLGYNFTDFSDCVDTSSGGNITSQDYADFLFNIETLDNSTLKIFEDCVETSDVNGITLEDMFTDSLGGNSTGGIGGNSTTGGTSSWQDWIAQNCLNTTATGSASIDLNCTEDAPFLPPGINITDFDPDDFQLDAENRLQLIPSMYLLASRRFPKHFFSQATSAYDYVATTQLASQYSGTTLPGVTFTEQKLFYELSTMLYESYLLFMPDNYLHFVDEGDWHGHLVNDRHYRVVDHKLYQVLYAKLHRIDAPSLPSRLFCSDTSTCEIGVDSRETTVYY